MADKEKIRGYIRTQYTKVAKREVQSCCSDGCGCSDATADIGEVTKKLGYSEQDFYDAPYESNMGLGCGNPMAIASLKEGETVLDLGSGGALTAFNRRKQGRRTGMFIAWEYSMIYFT